MNFIFIFTALATTALAKGSTECNFSEPTAARCFGAVGQLLIFHLPKTSNTDIRLIKDDKYVIITRGKTVTMDKKYVNQSELFPNGTFKLGNAMKNDSGDYVLEQFGSDGFSLRKVRVHLEIQAPVSKPVVSQMCVSTKQMNISCSSEGEEVEFILTLDDLLLMETRGDVKLNETEDKSSALDVTISLHGQIKGNLMCRVWNNVSRKETVIHLTRCKDFFPFLIMVVIASAVTLLLFVALFLGVKNLQNKERPTTVNEGNSEDEIVYADVIVLKSPRTKRPNSPHNATGSSPETLHNLNA